MYRMNDLETVREYHRALIGEAEGKRLARRQLKEARPKGEDPHAGRVRRRAALLLSTIGLAVLLAAGAAYALDVQCSPSAGGDVCLGTQEADVLQGTDGLDSIVGLGGDDTIRGLAAPTGSRATATRRRPRATTTSRV